MDWVFEQLTQWVAESIKGGLNQLLQWSVDLTAPVTYWRDGWAADAHQVVIQVAWSLLALRVTYEALRLYILRDVSDGPMAPGVLLRRAVIAAFWISATGPAVQWLYEFAYGASGAIAGRGVDMSFWRNATSLLDRSLIAAGLGNFMLQSFVIGAFAVGLLLLKMQAAIRGAELLIAYVFGPVFALSAVANDDYLANGTLAAWWREVLVCSLAQVVQVLILLALMTFTAGSGLHIGRMILALPILYVAIKSPTILRQYAYHTGLGRAASGGGMSAVSTVAMRTLTKMPF